MTEPLNTLRDAFDAEGIDVFIVSDDTNVRYLTGYSGGSGVAVIGREDAVLVVPRMFMEGAEGETRSPVGVCAANGSVLATAASIPPLKDATVAGFESSRVTCRLLERMKEAGGQTNFVPVTDMIAHLRAVKTPEECGYIVRAQRIAESVLTAVLGSLVEGVTERETAAEIDYRLRLTGGEKASFDTIVAFGENAAKPHAVPGDRKLRHGDMIVVDMGTLCRGYASDMTRTYVFGKASGRLRDVYAAVLEAQINAIGSVAAGAACQDVDRSARTHITNAGYGDRFIHSTGHGVGLEVHEWPRLSATSEDRLEAGMVVTVEPGIYIPGWGGVRIEDMVAVAADGCENLTNMPKELIEL